MLPEDNEYTEPQKKNTGTNFGNIYKFYITYKAIILSINDLINNFDFLKMKYSAIA